MNARDTEGGKMMFDPEKTEEEWDEQGAWENLFE